MSTQLSLNLDNKIELQEQFRGAFIGAAIGDALGFITEFVRSSNDLQQQFGVNKLTKLVPWKRITRYQGKKYTIKLPLLAGTYSDDTQLTLATARSIQSNGTFDVESFSKLELPMWLNYQLGGGSGTKAAARNLLKKNTTWYNNFFHLNYTQYINGGGNGAAMRILPIALANTQNPEQRYQNVWRNTIVTHGHLRGLIGAVLMADAISLLLETPANKLNWFDTLTERCHETYPQLIDTWSQVPEFSEWQKQWEIKSPQPFKEVLQAISAETTNFLKVTQEHIKDDKPQRLLSKLGCYDRHTKGAGNSTVVAAMFYLCRSSNFEEAIISVTNQIGIDTDTIGYFVGAMFGAYYGLDSIPIHFRENIQDRDYLLEVADWCYQVNSNTLESRLFFTYPDIKVVGNLNSTAFLPKTTRNTDTLIELPVLGPGKLITDRDITPNWRNNHVYWLQVSLDFGQKIFLQVTRPVSKTKGKPDSPTKSQSDGAKEQKIIASLSILDNYKSRIEASNFDPNITLEVIQEIKFIKHNRALYNAFTTWLWGALPENVSKTEIKNLSP